MRSPLTRVNGTFFFFSSKYSIYYYFLVATKNCLRCFWRSYYSTLKIIIQYHPGALIVFDSLKKNPSFWYFSQIMQTHASLTLSTCSWGTGMNCLFHPCFLIHVVLLPQANVLFDLLLFASWWTKSLCPVLIE